jgi:hypothetical protein
MIDGHPVAGVVALSPIPDGVVRGIGPDILIRDLNRF